MNNNQAPANEKPGDSSYEYNTDLGVVYTIFSDFLVDAPYSIEAIQGFIKHPMEHNRELREFAWWAYRSNGSVTSAVDYMRTMHTLDGVAVCKTQKSNGRKPSNFDRNRSKMLKVLKHNALYDAEVIKAIYEDFFSVGGGKTGR